MNRTTLIIPLVLVGTVKLAAQCTYTGTITAVGASTPYSNVTTLCNNWSFSFISTGFTRIIFSVESTSASNIGFSTWVGTTPNPTSLLVASNTFSGLAPAFVRVNLIYAVGTGGIMYTFSGTSPTGSGGSGTIYGGLANQFAQYAATGTAVTGHTLVAADIPTLSYNTLSSRPTLGTSSTLPYVTSVGSPGLNTNMPTELAVRSALTTGLAGKQATLTFTGNGTKTVSSTGAGVSGNCAKWDANGNIIDQGAPCGSGSGSLPSSGGNLVVATPNGTSGVSSLRALVLADMPSGLQAISTPATTTSGYIPLWGNTTGSTLTTGLGVVTTVGSSGFNTNIPTEEATRNAITAAIGASGVLPGFTGIQSVLISNGTSASWGNVPTGGSGGLDCSTVPGTCDIVTAIVPLKPAANAWTGANDFSGASFIRFVVVSATDPGCTTTSNLGSGWLDITTATANHFKVCAEVSSTIGWQTIF